MAAFLHPWLGGAAAGIARLLTDPPADPGIGDLLKRLLEAALSIAGTIPSGQPFNGVEFLLKVFNVAGEDKLGDSITNTLMFIVNAPDISFTVWGYIITIATMCIAVPLALFNLAGYWKRFQDYRRIAGHAAEAEVMEGRNASMVSPKDVAIRAFVVFILLFVGGWMQQQFINTLFQFAKKFVEGFYSGAQSSIGGVFAQLLLEFVKQSGGLSQSVLLVGTVFVAVIIATVVTIKRVIEFLLSTVEVFVILAHVTAGRREVTLGTAAAYYLRRLGFLALTLLVLFLGPLAIQELGLTGAWPLVGVVIVCWAAVAFPRSIFGLMERLADEDMAKDYFANRDAANTSLVNNIKLALTLMGTGVLAGTTLAFPELAPVVALGGAVAGGIRQAAQTGDVRQATQAFSSNAPKAVEGLRTFRARFTPAVAETTQADTTAAAAPAPTTSPSGPGQADPSPQPVPAVASSNGGNGSTANAPVTADTNAVPTEPASETEESVLLRALPLWAQENGQLTDAMLGYLAGMYLNATPPGDRDTVIKTAHDCLEAMPLQERTWWAVRGARIRQLMKK